jgi:toxin CcdB
VPLAPLRQAPKPARTLNPLFTFEGVEHVMLTQYAAAIGLSELEREVINLGGRREEIVAALDLLLQGF